MALKCILIVYKKQIKLSQQSAVDWASFHREITYDAMITQHKKIGKFLNLKMYRCNFYNSYKIKNNNNIKII